MSFNNTVQLSAPALLVAMPHLNDGPFAQGVLLLTRHDDTGSMGLIINRRSGVSLGTFASSLGVQFADRDHQDLHVGGPVEQERAFILHDGAHRGPETTVVLPPLALSFSMESLAALAQQPPERLRICVGYAGWGTGQLAQELSLGSWTVATASADFIFNTPPEHMWHEALKTMGIEPLMLMQRPSMNN